MRIRFDGVSCSAGISQFFNDRTISDNQEVPKTTGGELDSDVGEPGLIPIPGERIRAQGRFLSSTSGPFA